MTTVGLALVAALFIAGCGDDDTSKTSATRTLASATTTTGSTTTDRRTDAETTSGSKSSGTQTTGSKLPAGSSTSSGTKASGTSKPGSKKSSSGSGSKASSGTKTSGAGSSSDDSGSGPDDRIGTSNSREERLDVVSVVRRYQKAFIDFDGREVCSLLTSAGRKIMISGARSQTCPSAVLRVLDQATKADLELLKTTRDGITTKDVTIRDGKAAVDIGGGEKLRLVVEDGAWLVADPSP